MTRSRSEKGIASVIFALTILTLMTSAYVIYQAYGVPGYCKQAEGRMLSEFIENAKDLSRALTKSVGEGVETAAVVKHQYPYPSIPFFTTPSYASVTSSTYDISVTIQNLKSDEVTISPTITLTGKAVELSFDPVFSTPVKAFVELGIVATDGAYIGGSFYSSGSLFFPFFDGPAVTNQLYPVSGGGHGILVSAQDPSRNITITIDGSKIVREVWQKYAETYGLSVSFDSSGRVTIELPPGTYLLKGGVASFIQGGNPGGINPRPHYLYSKSPTTQQSPAAINLEVLDEYFNPIASQVTVEGMTGNVEVCTVDHSSASLSCSTLSPGRTLTYTDDGVSFIARNPSTDVAVLKTYITGRPGGPYQLAFAIKR